jgi:membrane protease YdiL (CAAX protease family)
MSMVTATFDLPAAGPLPAPLTPRSAARPWGFWATLGWGLFAAFAGLVGAIAYSVIWMLTHHFQMPDPENAIYSNIAGIVASVTPIVVLVVAIAIRKSSQLEYFGLCGVSRRDLLLGVASLCGLIAVFTALTSLLGIDDGSTYMETTYQAAKLAGVLPLLWISVVVVAPVTEELLFRGFLHRGWAASWLGATGTIALTSVLWAALHQQYNWAGILFIFLMGLIFGWMRQRTGSTTLTIALHGFNNLLCTVLVAVKLEWLS